MRRKVNKLRRRIDAYIFKTSLRSAVSTLSRRVIRRYCSRLSVLSARCNATDDATSTYPSALFSSIFFLSFLSLPRPLPPRENTRCFRKFVHIDIGVSACSPLSPIAKRPRCITKMKPRDFDRGRIGDSSAFDTRRALFHFRPIPLPCGTDRCDLFYLLLPQTSTCL